MKNNIILLTDSYKYSHLHQYPPGTEYASSYIEARGGESESVFFGAQALIKQYLEGPVVTRAMVNEAQDLISAHGEPFYREPWDIIVDEFGGRLPIEIEAVAEGTVMPTSNVQMQITNTDPRFFWLPSFLETVILRAIWYPSTVATKSRKLKKVIAAALHKTSDVPVMDQLMFKLHDFGARGASSSETAMLGGMGHLVNFMGTDTVEALVGARRFYGETVAGYSIPASEHSTITAWGRENESAAYANMIELFSGEGKLYACVSDSYDIYNAVRNIWGDELKQRVIEGGGTLVVRPDSGDPLTVPVEVVEILMEQFGYTVNSKGFRVLPPYIRVIQGDGIDEDSLPVIIDNMIARGLSIDNIAFGMGGGLLQAWNRDTLRYAMKASAIKASGENWRDIYKDPVHGGKTSKRGRLGLVEECGLGSCGIRTLPLGLAEKKGNLLRPIFRNGELLIEDTFTSIRDRAALKTEEYVNATVERY
jgi:nicotinamide phosphoribosyltransferase